MKQVIKLWDNLNWRTRNFIRDIGLVMGLLAVLLLLSYNLYKNVLAPGGYCSIDCMEHGYPSARYTLDVCYCMNENTAKRLDVLKGERWR